MNLIGFTLLAACFPLISFAQGNLSPSGPPGPAMKTLDQIEPRTPISSIPYTITNGGSYYVTTNLTATAGHGIVIQANNVSVDLNGFTLAGTGVNIGVFAEVACTNIVIRNGILRRWGTGLDTGFSRNVQLHRLIASQNGTGISGGQGTLATECTADTNTFLGIGVEAGSTVFNCIARRNGGIGILVGSGGVLTACTSEFNGGDGFSIDRGIIKDCAARENTGDGIDVFINCHVIGNQCLYNGASPGDAAGIHSRQGGNRIEGNNVVGNDRGIDCNPSTGNLIIRNSANGNGINYDIVAGNTTGPIVTTSTIGTNSNPHANYTY